MIPVSPVRRENAALANEINAAMAEVVDSGELILGPHVGAFEDLWAAETSSRHCVGLASGLDALEAGLHSIGVAQGDVVIVPAMSAAATALAPIRLGATPVFVDVNPSTALLDLVQVLEICADRKPSAVIPVALYGLRPEASLLRILENELGVPVVMDMAQAHGSLDEQGRAEVPGHVAAWSFYPTKNLGAIGDAGALTTNSSEISARACRWRNYGQESRYEHLDAGVNSRLDEIQAAVLTVKLARLTAWTTRRREIAQKYLSALDGNQLECLVTADVVHRHALHQFVVLPSDRREFISFLTSRDIGSDVHYPKALPDQPAFNSLVTLGGGAPVARATANHAVSIPVHPLLTDTEVERIALALHDWCQR